MDEAKRKQFIARLSRALGRDFGSYRRLGQW